MMPAGAFGSSCGSGSGCSGIVCNPKGTNGGSGRDVVPVSAGGGNAASKVGGARFGIVEVGPGTEGVAKQAAARALPCLGFPARLGEALLPVVPLVEVLLSPVQVLAPGVVGEVLH